MRFLVDNALSPALATLLTQAGHDALHVRTIELQRAEDIVIFDKAAAEDRIVVSADTDFGALLAARNVQKPSVIQFRGPGSRKADACRAPFCRISHNLQTYWNAAASSRSNRRAYACALCLSIRRPSTE